MNQGVIIGVVAFILWGSVSSWWYVCKIKGLCEDPEPVAAIVVEELSPADVSNQQEVSGIKADTLAGTEPLEEATLTPISLHFDEILFTKNSLELINPDRFNDISSLILDTLDSQDGSMVIVGHTCDLGEEAYNDSLGLARAKRISELLRTQGLTLPFTLESAGESRPLNGNANETERAQNRRVEIDIKSNPK